MRASRHVVGIIGEVRIGMVWCGEMRLLGEGAVQEVWRLVHVCSGEHHERKWLYFKLV